MKYIYSIVSFIALALGTTFLLGVGQVNSSEVITSNSHIEVAFSPEINAAEDLVVKTIDAAQTEIRLMAYSFSSPNVTNALVRAYRRGVEVKMVVDYRNNVSEDINGRSRHALNTLRTAGIEVRTVGAWATQHSKLMVIDQKTVQTGSFNYTKAAATKNSENVIVIHDNPAIATAFLEHWQSRFDKGTTFKTIY